MSKRRVKLTFPETLITRPIIYDLSRKYNVVFNIRRADVADDRGWVILELEGTTENIDKGLEWATKKGVRVDPVGGDVLEG